jgi:hypothetical protein
VLGVIAWWLGFIALLFAIHLMDVRGWLDWSGTISPLGEDRVGTDRLRPATGLP